MQHIHINPRPQMFLLWLQIQSTAQTQQSTTKTTRNHSKNLKMVDKALFSSNSGEWQTPLTLFKKLNKEFDFYLDPCTTTDNPLHTPLFYTKEDNGLEQDWFGTAFVNPPYNQEISKWLFKAYHEFTKTPLIKNIVFLLPVRTDTKWFHQYIYNEQTHNFYPHIEVRFIKGRLKFGNSKNSAPFPSMLVVFNR